MADACKDKDILQVYDEQQPSKSGGKIIKQCSDSNLPKQREHCQFEIGWLASPCSKPERWGYNTGQPCIILSFDEPENWEPEPYASLDELPREMPATLVAHITDLSTTTGFIIPKMLWVSCSGVTPRDKDRLGEVSYSPWHGFPAYYFPLHANTPLHATPLLALQLQNPQRGVVIGIRCRFWARNIDPAHVTAHMEFLMD